MSASPLDLARGANTKINNLAAGEFVGVSRAAIAESVHLLVNAMTFANLYVVHFAVLIGGCLRAQTRDNYGRLRDVLAICFRAESVALNDINIAAPLDTVKNWHPRKWIADKWCSTARYC